MDLTGKGLEGVVWMLSWVELLSNWQ